MRGDREERRDRRGEKTKLELVFVFSAFSALLRALRVVVFPLRDLRVLRGSILKARSLELFFQVAQRKPQRGRPAVRAVARALDEVAPRQQRRDLRGRQRVAGLYGGLAGHHVEDLVEQLFLVQVQQLL